MVRQWQKYLNGAPLAYRTILVHQQYTELYGAQVAYRATRYTSSIHGYKVHQWHTELDGVSKILRAAWCPRSIGNYMVYQWIIHIS